MTLRSLKSLDVRWVISRTSFAEFDDSQHRKMFRFCYDNLLSRMAVHPSSSIRLLSGLEWLHCFCEVEWRSGSGSVPTRCAFVDITEVMYRRQIKSCSGATLSSGLLLCRLCRDSLKPCLVWASRRHEELFEAPRLWVGNHFHGLVSIADSLDSRRALSTLEIGLFMAYLVLLYTSVNMRVCAFD